MRAPPAFAHQSAESIGRVAQDFSQEEAITVLTRACVEGAEKTQGALKTATQASA